MTRLAPQEGERIDRSKPLSFTLHGKTVQGFEDLRIDWTRLRAAWETDPDFPEVLERGLAQLDAEAPPAHRRRGGA